MIAKASLKYARVSPRKVREITSLLKEKPVTKALSILTNIPRPSKEILIKLLNSAVSNAKVKGLKIEQLFISKLIVNGGPTWKRFRAASFGRAVRIRKKTSHINLELDLIK